MHGGTVAERNIVGQASRSPKHAGARDGRALPHRFGRATDGVGHKIVCDSDGKKLGDGDFRQRLEQSSAAAQSSAFCRVMRQVGVSRASKFEIAGPLSTRPSASKRDP